MVASRWVRMARVARSYPRWAWNNWPVHFVGVVFCFIPMTVIVIYDIYKYGVGYDSMPYYRNYYHVVRPDDPIAVKWRPPEDYPAPFETNRANRWPTSYWRDYGFSLRKWKD
ncbi:unnamed protein product [Litomosoides sigmodontis]|uniref:Uncharacterized protein n=1 Tax=Litomosoides sigmodontis TaxID=42156 RepID=A0A3P6SQ66_LITSI|nr:unnamed protein product [Litomosoides sigmodontis]VDK72121.1 unnamed protein product [Litomosoides sigmodontis]